MMPNNKNVSKRSETIPPKRILNPITLSFQGECQHLEKLFVDEYNTKSLNHIRVSLFLGFILYAVFGALDAALVPEQKIQLWFIRYAVVCPCILISILFSFIPKFKKYIQACLVLLMVLAGSGISIMVAIATPPANFSYYAGLILVFMMSYGFIKARFIWACITGWINVVFYEIVAVWIVQTPGDVLLNNNFFFISANIIGMFICYSSELYSRKSFFMALQLEATQNKTITLNRELEQRVKERTADINQTNEHLQKEIEAHEKEKEERRQAEIELIESEKRFRELAEMLPETIYEVDLMGNITFVNLRAFDIFGYTKNDVANGINIVDLIHEKDREKAKSNILKILNGEDVGINEYYVQKKDGSFIPALLHSSIISKDKEPIGFRGFLIDISEKKRTQEILKQNEKMMSVGGLAAGMAHEINNPLAGMIQNAQLISNRLNKDLPANDVAAQECGTSLQIIEQYMQKRDIFKLLDNIKQAGRRAAGIVDNMLSFVRKNESGKSTKQLDELIERAIELAYNDYNLKKRYDIRKFEIIREYGSAIPPVLCEESKIQQVLFNLIKNASEAISQNNGHHDHPRLIFRLKKLPTMVGLEIEDNGPGMSLGIQKRVFEPFFTTKSINEGTGLGLSVSYFIIVDDHNGKMEVESILGKGTKFIIKLPL